MQALGTGPHLWRVEVVLWTTNQALAREDELVDAVMQATTTSDGDDPGWVRDVTPTRSYDIQPPAPDLGVGIACWVRAESVGDAANHAWDVVAAAADRILHEPFQLWDLRVIPRSAILSGEANTKPLTR
jgi:hypothetical protein